MTKKRPIYVVDSAFMLSGVPLSGDMELYTTNGVISEFSPGGRSRRRLDFLLDAGMRVHSPDVATLKRVEEASRKTGDYGRLSKTDTELVALALELSHVCTDVGCEKRKVVIITDDYSIQNLSRELGIPTQQVTERGITEKRKWVYRCRGCGRYFDEPQKGDECPVCGSEVKSAQRKGRRKR